jgi:hypothetical protein
MKGLTAFSAEFLRQLAGGWLLGVGVFAAATTLEAAVGTPAPKVTADNARFSTTANKEAVSQFLNDLMPIAWQKRPQLHFHVYTEMTEEGRKWREPTREEPIYYSASPAKLVQTGLSQMAGERPPPAAELEETLKKALAENFFLPVTSPEVRPDIVIIVTYGSHGNLLAEPPFSEELVVPMLTDRDPKVINDALERTRFVAGNTFTAQLVEALRWERLNLMTGGPVSPEPDSAFVMFQKKGGTDRNAQILNLAFHTCYFVVATAYDFRGVEKKQRVPLWQTRMSVSPQGVTMDEVLKPLIVNTGAFLGRETPESEIAFKRLDRAGHVEVGTPTVVPEQTPPPRAGGKAER